MSMRVWVPYWDYSRLDFYSAPEDAVKYMGEAHGMMQRRELQENSLFWTSLAGLGIALKHTGSIEDGESIFERAMEELERQDRTTTPSLTELRKQWNQVAEK